MSGAGRTATFAGVGTDGGDLGSAVGCSRHAGLASERAGTLSGSKGVDLPGSGTQAAVPEEFTAEVVVTARAKAGCTSCDQAPLWLEGRPCGDSE